MLASCLDAADSLAYPLGGLALFPSHESTDVVGGGGASSPSPSATTNSAKLLAQITHDLENGMPELKGEFALSTKRVWRGMGRIAARKVDVESVYHHEAAPVPGAVEESEKETEVDSHHSHQHDHHHEHHSHDHIHHDHSHSHDGPKEQKSQVREFFFCSLLNWNAVLTTDYIVICRSQGPMITAMDTLTGIAMGTLTGIHIHTTAIVNPI